MLELPERQLAEWISADNELKKPMESNVIGSGGDSLDYVLIGGPMIGRWNNSGHLHVT